MVKPKINKSIITTFGMIFLLIISPLIVTILGLLLNTIFNCHVTPKSNLSCLRLGINFRSTIVFLLNFKSYVLITFPIGIVLGIINFRKFYTEQFNEIVFIIKKYSKMIKNDLINYLEKKGK